MIFSKNAVLAAGIKPKNEKDIAVIKKLLKE